MFNFYLTLYSPYSHPVELHQHNTYTTDHPSCKGTIFFRAICHTHK